MEVFLKFAIGGFVIYFQTRVFLVTSGISLDVSLENASSQPLTRIENVNRRPLTQDTRLDSVLLSGSQVVSSTAHCGVTALRKSRALLKEKKRKEKDKGWEAKILQGRHNGNLI